MTLHSRIAIVEPTSARDVFDEARRLIGASEGEFEEGPTGYENKWGQGFPSWVGVHHGGDEPLRPDYEDEDGVTVRLGPPVEEYSIEVGLDTAYSYRGPYGGGCSALHAWIIRELGRWLTERGLTWYWHHEYDGTWHPSSDPITILGDPERGRLRD